MIPLFSATTHLKNGIISPLGRISFPIVVVIALCWGKYNYYLYSGNKSGLFFISSSNSFLASSALS